MLWIFSITIVVLLASAPNGQTFDTFEHRYIGNAAVETLPLSEKNTTATDWTFALDELGLYSNESSRDEVGNEKGSTEKDYLFYTTQQSLTFGDLPALAGDHVGDVETLETVLDLLKRAKNLPLHDTFQDRLLTLIPFKTHYTIESERLRFAAMRRQWIRMCEWLSSQGTNPFNRFSSLKHCPKKALDSDDLELRAQLVLGNAPADLLAGSDGYPSSRSEGAEFEQMTGYIALVSKNKTHFPQYSWEVYIHHHKQAIEKAGDYAKAKSAGNDSEAKSALKKAILYEGFAQHFLQDSYSSGHIGARYDGAQKDLLQHTHDTLNHIGLPVRIPVSSEFLWPNNDPVSPAARKKTENGWLAFGDRHLFIPEAVFHRFVVVHVASRSLEEIWQASNNSDSPCQMCTEKIFPVPDPLASEIKIDDGNGKSLMPAGLGKDPRVPPLYSEGWKLLSGFGTYRGQSEDEKNSFDKDSPLFSHEKTPGAEGTLIELGYVRSTGPGVPNYFGVGFSNIPNVSTSIYPLSVGYRLPNEITAKAGGWYGGVRLNVGYRKVEAGSFLDTGTKDLSGVETTVVFDGGYQIRSPLSLFMRVDLLSIHFRSNLDHLDDTTDSLLHNGVGGVFGGIQYDLAGVFK